MQKTAFNIHDNSFIPHIHLRIREEKIDNILLFGTCWQMALCFGELLVLPIFGLMAYFIGMNVFYVSCATGCVGLYMTWSYMRNWTIKNENNQTKTTQ
jgi:type IV secretory pathway TrbD component